MLLGLRSQPITYLLIFNAPLHVQLVDDAVYIDQRMCEQLKKVLKIEKDLLNIRPISECPINSNLNSNFEHLNEHFIKNKFEKRPWQSKTKLKVNQICFLIKCSF